MHRKTLFGSLAIGIAATVAAIAPAGASAGSLSADYRFDKSFTSSVGNAKTLEPVGPLRVCPPCEKFGKEKVNGDKQGVWKWLEGDGLRMNKADKVLGHGGKTYTIAMLVRLDTVESYRKLVDFVDLTEDEGWYVYNKSLYPYDLGDFNYDKERIPAGKWRQIVLTRDGKGKVKGYVDGELLGKDKDKLNDISLGEGDKLHFLIDDGGSEHSGGAIARLRVWENALPKSKIKHLDE